MRVMINVASNYKNILLVNCIEKYNTVFLLWPRLLVRLLAWAS